MPSGAGNLGHSSDPSRSRTSSSACGPPALHTWDAIAAEIEHGERRARHVGIEQQVHRPGRLVVGLGGVEDEAVRPSGPRSRVSASRMWKGPLP